ncbi:NAD-dependent methanol dehydrogenase [Anaerohalosphaera lusitana]|uniref:NAD-dependent methanol dehydrogenase n=1 Tax=Anaerohalosphaera lusitana TaxID=1936003 RepID=A0A1U9NHA0_9BACT|nr:iron-containing alcohol dehydrogenase [Anaerohalosphaera lusitana]AQT67124.1 NAD-dependent methanol dehydrogenase [Anaerohalosphaera lusitana]
MSGIGESIFKFVCPEVVFGVGSRGYAARYAFNTGMSSVLLVSDEGVFEAGWGREVVECLEEAGLHVAVYTDVTPNPKDYEVMKGVEIYQYAECDGIIAVGGGSVIDCAKGIGVVVSNGGDIKGYAGVDTIRKPGPPLICVPTTAGTGADVSQFAVITDSFTKEKMCLVSKTLVPDVSLVDPETTCTMDRGLTAATGMDAFAHAIEAIVSNGSSHLTELHATEAIKLIHTYFEKVCENRDDMEATVGMMLASTHAGMAFSNASLGLVHAMAHALAGVVDVSHGVCTAMVLPYVMDYNMAAAEDKYKLAAEAMGVDGDDAEWMEDMSVEVGKLLGNIGESSGLREAGVSEDDIGGMADKAMKDATIVTNPRKPTRQEVEMIYERAM